MHYLSLETAQPVDLGPCNVVQVSSRADEDIRRIVYNSSVRRLYLDVPFAARLVVPAVLDLMSQLDKPVDRKFICRGFEVGLNLLGRSIKSGPVRIGVEGVLVGMRGNL